MRVAFACLLLWGCSDSAAAVDGGVDGAVCTAISCDDRNSCTNDHFDLAACRCVHDVVPNCCGNGLLESGEFCDDGNQIDGDGCSFDCHIEAGMVLHAVTFLDGTQGCDLDGNPGVDNAYGGAMNDAARNEISSLVTEDLQQSCAAYVSLWVLEGTNPQMDGTIDLSLQLGVDQRVPPVPSEYFSGSEPFYVMPDGLDPNQHFRARLGGSAPAGAMQTQSGDLRLYLPTCMVTERRLPYDFRRARISGTLTNDASGPTQLSALFCGVETVATLYRVPNGAGLGGATLLDLAVLGFNQFGYQTMPTQPDIDLDGDGRETFMDTDGDSRVDLCIDGNGAQILGTDCPTDPRIADGYSMAVHLDLVGARLAGPRP